MVVVVVIVLVEYSDHQHKLAGLVSVFLFVPVSRCLCCTFCVPILCLLLCFVFSAPAKRETGWEEHIRMTYFVSSERSNLIAGQST